jgi:hypothetical protein
LEDSFDDTNRHFMCRIQEFDIRDIENDERGKTMGPDGISIEVSRCLEDVTIWLTKLSNHIFRSNKMSDVQRSILVPS